MPGRRAELVPGESRAMASISSPAVQSSYMKNLFLGFEARGLREGVRVRDPELEEEVAAAGRLSWLPIAINIRTVDALCDLLGESDGLEVLAECVYGQFETPLWKPLIGGGLQLLGRDPGRLARWLPRAFSVVFRDCGCWEVQQAGARELAVLQSRIPELLISEHRWLRSLGTGMNALFRLCDTRGTVDLLTIDEDLRAVQFRLRW
jgi:hypothetical protein